MTTFVQQGNLTADQPTAGTGVAGGSVLMAITGTITSWSAALSGTFSSGSTVNFDYSVDGVTWTSALLVQDGTSNPAQSSVAGPQASPISFTGSCASHLYVQARCHPYHAGDTIAVSITATGADAVTANAGTNTSTASLALESGGNLAAVATSTASTATSTATTATNTGTTATNTSTTATNTGTIATRTPVLGQAAMAASSPVVVASDQSNLPTNIKQINGSTISLGSTTGSASLPVVVASDQAAVPVKPQAATSGGGTPFHLIASSGVNNTSVKGSAGTLYGFDITNFSAAVEYVKFANKATAPSAGSETVVINAAVPAASGAIPGKLVRHFPVGEAFSAGIALFTVTGISNGNGTGVAQNDLLIEADYS